MMVWRLTLTDKDIEIIGGEPGVIVSYHETLSDAENNIFPIGSPYQNIVANLQVVYVRATYDDVPPALGTGCWRVVELELIVNPTPIVPLDLEPIIACDPDMDGLRCLISPSVLLIFTVHKIPPSMY